jgi:hypothetical protein
MAKICNNCGQVLPPINLDKPPAVEEANTTSVAAIADTPNAVKRAKRCPNCATICKLDAKVCPNCGHRFQTDFSQASPPPPPDASLVTPPPRVILGEAPIVQMASTGITLPPDKPQPIQLPPDPTPPPAPLPVKPAPIPPPVPPVPPVDDADSTEGEPAPDVTDVDLSELRRRGSDQATGRFTRNNFFKKDSF